MPNEQIPEDQEQEDKEIKRQRFFWFTLLLFSHVASFAF